MATGKLNLIIHRQHWLRATFIILTLMYFLSLAGTGLVTIAYEKYFGDSSPVQSWLNQNATSYSTDIYEVILVMQDMTIAYREAASNKTSQKARQNLKDKVDLLDGLLGTFQQTTVVAQRIKNYASAPDALKAAKKFHDLVRDWVNNSPSITDALVFNAEEKALFEMRRLVTESVQKEFQAQDEMVLAINSGRMLADRALLIGVVLLVFGLFALISVYWALKAWMAAERERFNRLEYLLSTVGHDLRSPLQAIVSCAQLLRKSYTSGDNKTYAGIIKDSSEQLARLVHDLVDLARNEELSFEPHPLELNLWMEKITARFAVDAERKGLEFIANVEPDGLPSIMFDEIRLTQCVGNVLSNAIHYTDSGSIKLTVTHTKKNAQGELLIEVQDTGAGIAVADRTRIFMPFERASSKRDGKGLGLAIVSSIVRAAHGKISLKTEVGEGSTFSITLPVTYSTVIETPAAIPTETRERDGGGERVLIVDDDPSLRSAFAGIIADMGYASDQVSDGEEGFKLASASTYHAIVTDIQMPGWDGFQLAQACRENLQPCPILIAITAYTKTLSLDPRADIFDKILYKPINDELLLEALEAKRPIECPT